MTIDEYLVYRFRKNNHNKYLKYMQEWINGITKTQLDYFKKEKERLNL